jgi:hypothetical protein
MGRYYSGDIEGKFWLGVQPSDDAEQFGAVEGTAVTYHVEDRGECRERLEELFKQLDRPVNLKMSSDKARDLADRDGDQSDERQGLYASLELGLKIYQCIERNGYCTFEAEC